MNAKDLLEKYRVKVDSKVQEILFSFVRGSIFEEPLRYALLGGKKFRPTLLVIAHDACGGKGDPFPAGAAVELVHTVSLIHDDIIDDSDTRRGKPSFHVKYGLDFSLLVADYSLATIWELVKGYRREVMDTLSMAVREMAEGQAMEEKVKQEGRLSMDTYLDIIRRKTASLVAASASVGAIIAGREDLSGLLWEYGEKLGMAYQIWDDLRDRTDKELMSFLLEDISEATVIERMRRYAELSKKYLLPLKDTPQKEALLYLVDYLLSSNE